LQFRTQTKLCAVDTGTGSPDSSDRQLWPLKTNTLSVPVAGPGSVLFFRYQVFIILLALVLLLLWVAFLCLTGGNLLVLGTADPKSPRELCKVIHAGYETRTAYMSMKASFVLTAYVTSSLLCILFAIHQRRTFRRLNVYPTHADFVVFLEGLPPVNGSEKLEELLRAEVQKVTKQEVVGVSVGWDVADHMEKIQKVLEEDVLALVSADQSDKKGDDTEEIQAFSRLRPKWLRVFDNLMLTKMLGIDMLPPLPEEKSAETQAAGAAEQPAKAEGSETKPTDDPTKEQKVEDVRKPVSATEALATVLVSTHLALAVFKTEAGRDAALSCDSMTFLDKTVKFKRAITEPMGVQWANLTITKKMRRERLYASIKMIATASLAWAICIYLPYACYASSFSYSNGDKPTALMTISLTVIVVLGNLLMYTTCAEAANRIGYMLKDTEDGVYMVLYTFSILVNILLDASVAGYIAYRTAVANHARTYGGVLIADLTRAQAIFEAFEIQRQLAIQVYKYCWPSMFLIPFIGEAIGVNWFTLHLARLVVTTFPHIKGYKAQQALKILVPMDAGRYADVLINIVAAVLIFFLPGGYTMPLLSALILSNLFIVFFDHFRVLRCVPSFCFCSSVVDDYAQKLLILPCSLMLSAFILKYNCTSDSFCVQDSELGFAMLAGFIFHAMLHWWALKSLVPRYGDVKEHVPTKMTYQEVAAAIAPSWFNLNPAYCLRSKYFYKHEKPCTYLIQGREQVLRKSAEAMAFFEDQRRVAKEEYKHWRPG